MTRTRTAFVVLAGVGLMLELQACSSRQCGLGTVERAGDCVAEDNARTQCGAGTHLEPVTLVCVPDQYTCDPDTTYVADGGVCTGRVTDSLPVPPVCPAIGADEICVTGWLRDFDNHGQEAFSKNTLITDDSVELWVFDPFKVLVCTAPPCFDTSLALAGPYYANADGTYILDHDQQDPPRRIKATDSYIAIGTMNRGGTPAGSRNWVGSGITAPGQAGIYKELDIYAVSQKQVDSWEETAPGMLETGIFVTMWHHLDQVEPDFTKNRTFISGVLPNRSPAAVDIGSLYFMTDDRLTLAQGSATGVNLTTEVGGAIWLGETLGNHSATGGDVPGSDPPQPIDWDSRLGASVPGLVFLQFFTQKLQ
jgi:hypothetical protein